MGSEIIKLEVDLAGNRLLITREQTLFSIQPIPEGYVEAKYLYEPTTAGGYVQLERTPDGTLWYAHRAWYSEELLEPLRKLIQEEAEKLIILSFGLRKEFTKPIGWPVANE